MTIAVLRLTLRLPAHSLKEKRAIVKSLVARLRTRFNASVAEIEALDAPERAVIGAVVVSNDSREADRQIQSIARTVEDWRLDAEIVGVETELISA